jgi:hypothetical protein
MISRRQLQDKHPALLTVISILTMSGASAFGPALHHVTNLPVRGDVTRRFVGKPWTLPILVNCTSTIKSTMPSSRLPAARTPNGIFASSLLVSQDASKAPLVMSDLVQQLDNDTDAIANNNSLAPILGGLAVLLLLTLGASVSGVL